MLTNYAYFANIIAMDITRTYPMAKYPFLRYQVGINTTRHELLATQVGSRVLDYHEGDHSVTVFYLMGWGETQDQAMAMAKKSKLVK